MASFVDISLPRDDFPETLSPTSPIDIISTVGYRQQVIEESQVFGPSRNPYLFEKQSISQEIKRERMDFPDENGEHKISTSFDSARPMTRAQVNRLNSQTTCKIE